MVTVDEISVVVFFAFFTKNKISFFKLESVFKSLIFPYKVSFTRFYFKGVDDPDLDKYA